MTWPLAFLAVTTWLAALLCRWLPGPRGLAERSGMTLAVALMLQLWIPFFTSKIFGIASGPALALILCAIAVIGVQTTNPVRFDQASFSRLLQHFRQASFRENFGILLFLTISLGWLFYTHSLQPTPAGLCSAGISWEDQSGHAMFASSFLWSDNLESPQYPNFNGWPLGYPFLPDLLAASLASLGASLGQAFWWSGWFAATSFVLLAWLLVRAWLGSGRRAWVALFLYLFSGGFGFFDFIGELLSGVPWSEALVNHDYANAWEFSLHYHNILTATILPLRASVLGMPVAFAILILFTRVFTAAGTSPSHCRKEWLAAGILTGLLPLVHAHSFLVVGFCGATGTLLFLPWRRWATPALFYAVPMLVIALPQLAWIRSQVVISEPFLRWDPGWTCEATTFGGWLSYWLHNGGLRVPLGLACWFFAPVAFKKITLPLLALLLLGNLFLLQPYAYDNIKLFAYSDLALAGLSTLAISALWKQPWRMRWVVFPVILYLTASGGLSIWRETRLCDTIVDWDGVAFAKVVRENTAPRSIFLTASELTHPVPVLTGRPLVLGYMGWLQQHGIPMGDRPADVKEIFAGSPNATTLLEKYHVDYVVIGPPEKREFPAINEEFFARISTMQLHSGPYTLYEIKKPENGPP